MAKRRSIIGLASILLFSFLLYGAGATGSDATLLSQNYYLISIGVVNVQLSALIQTAQANAYAVIVRSGDEVNYYRGDKPTNEDEATLIACDHLLYVDDGQFLLRVKGTDCDYTVRPEGDLNYTLVIVPHRDLPLVDTLTTIMKSLQKLGIVGSEVDMEFKSFPKRAEKSPAPPEGVAIDSGLYALQIAPDWFSAASAAGLTRVGLRVEVIAEKLPGEQVPEEFRQYIESETDSLAKLLLPISDLIKLAKDPAIGYLRPPYRPHPAVP